MSDQVTVLQKRPAKAADLKSKKAINTAMKNGTPIETTKKFNAATNKHSGPISNATKLENETENFHIDHVSMSVAKLIASQRAKLGITQKDLATKIAEKPQIINQYERGEAIPNQAVLGKLERALGVKLRGKDLGASLPQKGK